MRRAAAPASPALDRVRGLDLLHRMLRIRRFEERCAELYQATKIRGFLHLCDGEEAVAVGVCEALSPEDSVVSTYRDHGHALARGISMNLLLAELYGKQEGCSRGRGGSMHLFDRGHRFLGGNAIVGGGLPMAVGVALAEQLRGSRALACCFFGDGAAAEGVFHEALNLAALWSLPVLFVCENNLYAMGTAIQRAHAGRDLAVKAEGYGIVSRQLDGMEVLGVAEAAREAVEAIRAGQGPRFLECVTYRFRGHSMFDSEAYRSREEVEAWRDRCPIKLLIERLRIEGLLTEEDLKGLEFWVAAELAEAVEFAENGTWEPVEQLSRYLYMGPEPAPEGSSGISPDPSPGPSPGPLPGPLPGHEGGA